MENWTVIDPQTGWLMVGKQLIHCTSRSHYFKHIPYQAILDVIDENTYVRNIWFDSKNTVIFAKVDIYIKSGGALSSKTKKLISMNHEVYDGIPITIKSSIVITDNYSDHFSFYSDSRYAKTTDWVYEN